ncbi:MULTISPECIES: MetQ/NlpA family ABC transporter substrate-binding protein [Sutcliffiella]|nr:MULTISPECIES: MetQ/NlpA family ABC transporter substrate-binding protein [Sutcliffiella]WBL14564.1 MetQ/NlpA family ABC transporter substrate-binding protein [Sutcliffiella sp. NC1]
MKKILLSIVSLLLVAFLAACGGKDTGGALSEDKLVIGVTAGPHEQVMEKVKEVAAKDGLEIDIKVFTEYVMPNTALAEGELDVNSFQTKPFLDNVVKERNYDLVDIAPTLTFPMGIYSEKFASVDELEEGAKLGLPNDPTNGGRALILFQSAGLITLKDGVGDQATVKDIVDNPKNFEFIELEASQLPRQLDELAGAAINTNFAIEHGYVPTEDSIFIEGSDSPWVNLLVVRGENKEDPVLEKLLKAYHSDEVKQFIEETFSGSVIPSW